MSSLVKGRILIAGAGVAGLSAALECAARGWTVQLFEKAQALSEVGAGLQLAPNAMRHLQRLGVADCLSSQAVTLFQTAPSLDDHQDDAQAAMQSRSPDLE